MAASRFTIAALVVGLLCTSALAGASLPLGSAVGEGALDRVRGGFTSPDTGLQVSFGVRRAVYADGSGLPAGSVAGSGVLLVQRGDGNRIVGALQDAGGAATVVQNTLDNQKLQVITTIDVQTNGLRVSRALALQSAVGLGIAASLRR